MSWKVSDPMSERVKFIGMLMSGQRTVVGLCQEFGISRKTAYKWAERFEQEGLPGLEERCHDTLGHEQAGPKPRLGADWGPQLEHSGFAIMARRTFTISLTAPLPAATGRYAWAYLRRIRSPLEGRLTAGDLAALDTLLDSAGPGSVLNRGDLVVRGTRTAWTARRP